MAKWWWWWQCWCSGRVHRLMRLLPLHAGIPRRRPPIIWQMDACSLSTPYTPYFSISVPSSPFFYLHFFSYNFLFLLLLFSLYLFLPKLLLSPKLLKRKSTVPALHWFIFFHQFFSFVLLGVHFFVLNHSRIFLNKGNFSSVSCLSVWNGHGVKVLNLVSASIKCWLGRLFWDQTHRFLATADAFLSSPRK